MQQNSGYGPGGYLSEPGSGSPGSGQGYQPGQGYDPGRYGPPRARRSAGILSHAAVAVLAAALGAGAVLALNHPAPASSGSAASPAAPLPGASAVPAPSASPAAGGTAGSEQAVVNKVEPGLVVINTTLQYDGEAAAGTGMVINPAGLVLTNNHVIEDSTKITATVISTGKTYPAEVIGYDKTGDVALVRLQGASGLRTVPIGNSAAPKVGDPVVALGNAEGQGSITAAPGQVTGLDKTITASDQGGTATAERLRGMIQTDAGIVPGDSGGPLASTSGEVIGMDTAGNSVSFGQQAPAAGFAIPIDTALSVARQIAAGHASSAVTIGYPPFIGIFITSSSSSSPQVQAQQQEQQGGLGGFGGFGAPSAPPACYSSNADLAVPTSIAPTDTGALVDGTICGSPAAAAGMTGGAVITAVNGQPAGSPSHLTSLLARFRPGDTISVSWISPAGQHATSTLHLAAGPPQ